MKSLSKNQTLACFFVFAILVLAITGCAPKEKTSFEIFNPSKYDASLISSFNGDSFVMKDGALVVNFAPGKYGSIIAIRPSKGLWNASGYRFVRCEIENTGSEPQLVELGFGNYDLTLGGTIVPPGGKKTLKAVIYRTRHAAYIDSLFPVMHGKPDGTLRSWMKSTSDSVEYIKLLFPVSKAGSSVKIGRIWFEVPYVLYSAKELMEKYYPFVDRFGQLNFGEWPGKIHNEGDLINSEKKEQADLKAHPQSPEWNKYGGWENGPQLTSNGRFRVQKYEGKWWFVDPGGKLFWSNGFDCVESGGQTQTLVSGHEKYFEYLPAEGSLEAKLYSSRNGRENAVKRLSFNALNLFRKYGEKWDSTVSEKLHQRMHSWGFNTIGNWSDTKIYLKRKTPYVLTLNTLQTGGIPDPFVSGYEENLLKMAQSSGEEINDPWCIGVFIDNELKWGVKWGSKIGEQVQRAPETQPAKIAFMEMLKKKYKSITTLNNAWGTSFTDWKQFLGNKNVIQGASMDMKTFMNEFADLYYSKCRNAVKKTAPDLLYLGCRMDFHLYPEDSSLNDIIKIASRYCDVVSFNRYRYSCAELIPPDGGDYPLIIGEYHFGSLETGLLQPGLRYAADQNERAELFGYYLSGAVENPYIIGAHWFQLVDQSVAGRGDGENYQAGFLTVGDEPQKEMIDKSREIGYKMYKMRLDSK